MSQQDHAASRLDHNNRWYMLLLLFAGMAAYHNSFTGAWIFDDFSYIHENGAVQDLWTVGSGYPHPYRPVLQWTFSLNYALGGLDPFGYHLLNLIIHLSAGLALFGIMRRTLGQPRLRDVFGAHTCPLAWTIAAFWLVHPLQTESVTYIAQRSESLMGLFFFLSLYSLIRGACAASSSRAWGWYGLGCLAFSLGCGTKEVMAAGFGVLLLFDRYFLAASWDELHSRRWLYYLGCLAGLAWLFLESVGIRVAPDASGTGVRISTFHLITGLAGIGLVSWIYRRLGSRQPSRSLQRIQKGLVFGSLVLPAGFMTVILIPLLTRMSGYTQISAAEYALTQIEVITHYLRLVLWPDPLILDHAWPAVSDPLDIPGSLLVIGGLLAGTIWALFKRSAWAFPGAAFLILLAPTSSIIPLRDPAVEHRMYVPLAVVVATAVTAFHAGLYRLAPHAAWMKTVRTGAAAVICLLLCGTTVARNMDYQSPSTLWAQVTALYPDHRRAHLNLAQAYTQEGAHKEALPHYQKSLPFDWLNDRLAARYYYNFGLSLQAQNQLDAAEAAYREAVRLAPRRYSAALSYNQLGLIAVERSDDRQALQYFKAATRTAPYYAVAFKNLGILYAGMNRLKLAQQALHMAVRADPGYVDAHFALAEVFELQELYPLAADAYQTVMRLDPEYPEALKRQKALNEKRQTGNNK